MSACAAAMRLWPFVFKATTEDSAVMAFPATAASAAFMAALTCASVVAFCAAAARASAEVCARFADASSGASCSIFALTWSRSALAFASSGAELGGKTSILGFGCAASVQVAVPAFFCAFKASPWHLFQASGSRYAWKAATLPSSHEASGAPLVLPQVVSRNMPKSSTAIAPAAVRQRCIMKSSPAFGYIATTFPVQVSPLSKYRCKASRE
mmetsp:Transcript_77757/g.225654  ORF Transcript_77757/g.225654 Transcript_77757/m.225654 type:complete len:211 (+) Transcript_77757:1387-2019(+)